MSTRDQSAQSLQQEQDIYREFIRTHPRSRLEYKLHGICISTASLLFEKRVSKHSFKSTRLI